MNGGSELSHIYKHPSKDLKFAVEVVRTLTRAGHIAYFAGGCVRDALMGNEPQDFDIATDANTDRVRSLFGPSNTRAVGEAFGVVLVHGRLEFANCQVEVATFRSDGTYSDGRRPDWVKFGSPEEDALRRDFTINGLFYDPLEDRVIDYVDGQLDLQRGILRAIGVPDARIEEDRLRMLRAVRFAGRFRFALDPATFDAIQRHSEKILSVSGERIGIELKKILEHPSRAMSWERLMETRLADALLPEAQPFWMSPYLPERYLLPLSRLPENIVHWASAIAALLLPAAQGCSSFDGMNEMLIAVKERWKTSNVDMEAVGYALSHHHVLLNARRIPWSQLQPILVSPYAWSAVELAHAVALQSELGLEDIDHCRVQLGLAKEELNPRPWLTGADLIALGWKPGPEFTKILAHARTKQLDGELDSREGALAWLSQLRHSSDSLP